MIDLRDTVTVQPLQFAHHKKKTVGEEREGEETEQGYREGVNCNARRLGLLSH